MKGIKFGNKHSYDDFGLLLSSKTIGQASVKTNLVEIEGADGVLDLTEALSGRPTYSTRPLSFAFTIMDAPPDRLKKHSKVSNYMHGQKMPIILDDDPDYYYIGRISVGDLSESNGYATIQVDVDAQPYKYATLNSTEGWIWDPFCFEDGIAQDPTEYTVNGTLEVNVLGGAEVIVPEFITDGAMTISCAGVSHTVSKAGTYRWYDILFLDEGTYKIVFTGTGTVTVNYRRNIL